MTRRSIQDFSLANPVYVGASVSFFQIDDSGNRLASLATLYEDPNGAATLTNPQDLDSEGKFVRPVYIEEPVIGQVSGSFVDSHDTGIIFSGYKYRGEWASGVRYMPNDTFQATAVADGSGDLYIASELHTSAVFADDLTANYFDIIIDVSAIAAQFSVPATGGNANKFLRVNAAATAYILRTAVQLLADIGAEPADLKLLKANASQTITKGFPITPDDYPALSANPAVDFTKTRGAKMANDASGVIGLPSGFGEQVIILQNGATPGTPDISAFALKSGVFSTVPTTGETRIYIEKYTTIAYIWLEVLV